MKSLDYELKDNHGELLSRFYKLFESVHRYVTDLQRYLKDLEEGQYIQISLESIFLDEDGKQLLVRVMKQNFFILSMISILLSV